MSERYTLFSQGFHAYRIVQLCSWWCKAQVSNSKKIAKYSFTSLICQIYNVCQGTIREKPSLIAYDIFVLRIQCSEWIYRARICKPFKEPMNRFTNWQSYLTYTGPLGNTGWRKRFLGIDSWPSQTFTNTGSAVEWGLGKSNRSLSLSYAVLYTSWFVYEYLMTTPPFILLYFS